MNTSRVTLATIFFLLTKYFRLGRVVEISSLLLLNVIDQCCLVRKGSNT